MNEQTNDSKTEAAIDDSVYQGSWGPWLFRVALVAGLVFMWWLVIYDHGVKAVH